MNKIFKWIILVNIVVSFIGCATIMNPQKGPNTFNTDPSGAEVYDGNNIKMGTTPLDLNTIPQRTNLLKVKKEGYQDAEMEVRMKYRNDIQFVDAMLLCIPCIVDIGSKNIYEYYPMN